MPISNECGKEQPADFTLAIAGISPDIVNRWALRRNVFHSDMPKTGLYAHPVVSTPSVARIFNSSIKGCKKESISNSR